MATYRADRIICKQFNLSFLEIDDLYLSDYFCLLAEALDAEELEQYNYAVLTSIAFNNPKQLKNWKWSSTDKAGTQQDNSVQDAIMNFGKNVLKVNTDSILNTKRNPTAAMEFAKITGRDIIFMNPDGFLYNEFAELINTYNSANSIIVNIDYNGNYM